jgi:hypothetical protein
MLNQNPPKNKYQVSDEKPYPLRLGELRPLLLADAGEHERKLSKHIKKILSDYLISRGIIKKPS